MFDVRKKKKVLHHMHEKNTWQGDNLGIVKAFISTLELALTRWVMFELCSRKDYLM